MSKYPSLLPISSTSLEKDLEQIGLFTNDLGDLDLTIIHDPYRCPKSMLTWLAWHRHVDFYDESWSERKKRDVIAGAPRVHKIKGTVQSVRDVVRFAGYGEIEIISNSFNWFYNGVQKYDGRINYGEGAIMHWAEYIVVLETQVTTRQAQIIRGLINATAPGRDRLIELRYGEAIIYDGQHLYDGQFSFGVD